MEKHEQIHRSSEIRQTFWMQWPQGDFVWWVPDAHPVVLEGQFCVKGGKLSFPVAELGTTFSDEMTGVDGGRNV